MNGGLILNALSSRRGGGGSNIAPKPDTITHNGIYYASGDNLDGYSSVTVDVPQQGGDVGEKVIEQDGIYHASDDGLDGYDVVVVNVNGGVRSSMIAHGEGYTATMSIVVQQTDIVLQNFLTITVPSDTTIVNGYFTITDVTTGAYSGIYLYVAESTGRVDVPVSGSSVYLTSKWGHREGEPITFSPTTPPWNF